MCDRAKTKETPTQLGGFLENSIFLKKIVAKPGCGSERVSVSSCAIAQRRRRHRQNFASPGIKIAGFLGTLRYNVNEGDTKEEDPIRPRGPGTMFESQLLTGGRISAHSVFGYLFKILNRQTVDTYRNPSLLWGKAFR